MLLFINLIRNLLLQEKLSKRYIKIAPAEPAKLVINRLDATDFVLFSLSKNPNFFVLKDKFKELYLDKLDDTNIVGGSYVPPKEENQFVIQVDNMFSFQLRIGRTYLGYDSDSALLKMMKFDISIHYGFFLVRKLTDLRYADELKERSKSLMLLKQKYEIGKDGKPVLDLSYDSVLFATEMSKKEPELPKKEDTSAKVALQALGQLPPDKEPSLKNSPVQAEVKKNDTQLKSGVNNNVAATLPK